MILFYDRLKSNNIGYENLSYKYVFECLIWENVKLRVHTG